MNQTHLINPRDIIDEGRLSFRQLVAITLCIFLNALNGFDILSISFAAPDIAADWGINRATLGVVLSMELAGMAMGSVIIGGVADIIGRKPSIFCCLTFMGLGMLFSSNASGVYMLSGFRFLTGIGIGGMLATNNSIIAEYSNRRYRDLVILIMGAGYPLGVVFGGSFATYLLSVSTWSSIFVFGGIVTLSCIPLVWFLLPESVSYLATKQPSKALEKINVTLNKFALPLISKLPPKPESVPKIAFVKLFASFYIRRTIVLTISYIVLISTFYFVLKWSPKIVVDMGYAASAAGGVLVWANIGGASGAILLGILTRKFPVRKLVLVSLILAFLSVSYFGQSSTGLTELSIAAAFAGMFTTASVIGMFALFVHYFPPEIRASGTGFIIGVGQAVATLSPILVGMLFMADFSLSVVAIVMASGALVAGLGIFLLPKLA